MLLKEDGDIIMHKNKMIHAAFLTLTIFVFLLVAMTKGNTDIKDVAQDVPHHTGPLRVHAGERLSLDVLRELTNVVVSDIIDDHVIIRVSDNDLEQFSRAQKLKSITIAGCIVDGTVLRHFCDHDSIDEIVLTRSAIGDEAGRFLRRILSLDLLWLNDTSIGDPGVAAIWKISVNKLNLENTLVTDEGILRMPLNTQFDYLSLRNNFIGDRAARHLSRLTMILELDLGRTNVTATGAQAILEQHKHGGLGIRKLVLTGCDIKSEEIDQFRELYPEIEIEY